MVTPSKTGFTIKWDEDGERLYETGVERCALYPKSSEGYGDAVAWNGLTNWEESPTGAESNPVYADDQKYLDLRSVEEFNYTITALMYPDEFAPCDGFVYLDEAKVLKAGQQKRQAFGLCVTTKVGNDIDQSDYGYKLHLCYGSTASPSSKSHATENESPEAPEMSWECTTVGVKCARTNKNVAHFEIDMTRLDTTKRRLIEQALFGDGTNPGRLLTPDEVYELIYGAPETPSVTLSDHDKILTYDTTAGEGTSATLTAAVIPEGETVTWASSDDTKVTVSANGAEATITAAGITTGSVTITASITPAGGSQTYADECTVVVNAATPSEG